MVLYEKLNNAMRLVALDVRAESVGLRLGQSLSDARAICPLLAARHIDRDFTQGLFADFADWHTNLSPIVMVADDCYGFGDVLVDVTGVAHLFGGEVALLARAVTRLTDLGFSAQGAIGPSVGAALALARYAPGQVVDADTHDALEKAIAPLPVAALRLDEKQAVGLRQMGLKTIGQLYGRDRTALKARFGVSLLNRFDALLGVLEERLDPRLPVPERMAQRKFAEPIALISDVQLAVEDLSVQLAAQLAAEAMGAQTFHLMLYRVDHKLMHLAVNAARGTRDAGHIARLFANRMEKLVEGFDAGFGIEDVRLYASSVGALGAVQEGAFDHGDGAEDIALLVDRLSARLGSENVLTSHFVNTHIPEKSVVLTPAIAAPQPDMQALPDAALKRPLRLLPVPEDITVMAEVPDAPPARMHWRRQDYRFVVASGPERIAVEWWRPGEGALTRDYYVCEAEDGTRFWLFREGLYATETGAPRWFMHGVFA